MTIHEKSGIPQAKLTPLAGAIEMAAAGFPVFPLKPGTKDGFLSPSWKAQATTDAGRIHALAAQHPGCNWGARCSGHMVLDADVTNGKQGEASLLEVLANHHIGLTRVHRSARGGQHWFLRMPPGVEVTNRSPFNGIDVRGAGGYVVCPGSTYEDRPYTVECAEPIAEAPASLVALLRAPAVENRTPLVPYEGKLTPGQIVGLRRYLEAAVRVECDALAAEPPGGQHNAAARASVRVASLARTAEYYCLPVWEETADKLEHAFVEAVTSMQPSGARWTAGDARPLWRSAMKMAKPRDLSQELARWDGPVFEDASSVAAELAPPADAASIAKGEVLRWPVADEDGKPIAKAHANIKAFLQHIGASVYRDTFAERNTLDGFRAGPISDDTLVFLHQRAFAAGLSVPKEHFKDSLTMFALEHERHPVCEYLDGLQWDGVPRVASWLSRYLGAEESQLHREFGRLWLVAAVRRVRRPGCKFDTMLVLESAQGAGKSTALKILAGQWFEESMTLAAEPKVVIEQTRGRWIVEIAELSGISGREVEHVKGLLSRTGDTARGAYKEFETMRHRQFVLAGTTNSDGYLRDATGNRRFWPVKCGRIDLAGLTADRDQLWAEAVAIEARGGPLTLAEDLWAVAAAVQAEREEVDPLEDTARQVFGGGWGYIPTRDAAILLGFQNPTTADGRRISRVMGKVEGWRRKTIKDVRSFVRWSENNGAPPRFEPGKSSRLALVHDRDSSAAAADLLS